MKVTRKRQEHIFKFFRSLLGGLTPLIYHKNQFLFLIYQLFKTFKINHIEDFTNDIHKN